MGLEVAAIEVGGDRAHSPDYVLASIHARFICRSLDLIFLPIASVMVVLIFFGIPILALFGQSFFKQFFAEQNLSMAIMIAPNFLLFGVVDFYSGVSLFKWISGLRVIPVNGPKIGLKPALERNFYIAVDTIFWGIVAFKWMRRGRLKQHRGDRSAATVVINYRDSADAYYPSKWLVFKGLCLAVFTHATATVLVIFIWGQFSK